MFRKKVKIANTLWYIFIRTLERMYLSVSIIWLIIKMYHSVLTILTFFLLLSNTFHSSMFNYLLFRWWTKSLNHGFHLKCSLRPPKIKRLQSAEQAKTTVFPAGRVRRVALHFFEGGSTVKAHQKHSIMRFSRCPRFICSFPLINK